MWCAFWMPRVQGIALALGAAIAPLEAVGFVDAYEETIRTTRGVYVMRGNARAEQDDDAASSSITATTPQGRILFHRMTDLRPGCDGVSPRLLETRLAGEVTRIVLLCGSSGGPHETLFAFVDGTGIVADLDGDRSGPDPHLTDDGELLAHSSHSGPIDGVDGLFEFPRQHRLQLDGHHLAFVPISGSLFSPRAKEVLERHERAAAANPDDLPRLFVAAHTLLGGKACAHLRHEQPNFAALIGDSTLRALNRWVSSEMSVQECK